MPVGERTDVDLLTYTVYSHIKKNCKLAGQVESLSEAEFFFCFVLLRASPLKFSTSILDHQSYHNNIFRTFQIKIFYKVKCFL